MVLNIDERSESAVRGKRLGFIRRRVRHAALYDREQLSGAVGAARVYLMR